MSAVEGRVSDVVSCHAWNANKSKVAYSPGNNQIFIYVTNGKPTISGWTLEATLTEHDSFVSALDWSHVTNDIVSCSHDRNAYVWKCTNGVWLPTLVILRINRAATNVKWSPDGKKFAVTSGAKCVPVCHYEAANDWWISKMIKSHKSSVLTLDWCPNSKCIVTGGTDKRCRIFSAFIDTIESPDASEFDSIFPNQYNFGEVLKEFEFSAAWINAVAWSPDKFRIAFAAHNSTVSFAQIGNSSLQTIRLGGLPFTALTFLSNDTVVGAGYDFAPIAFVASGSASNPQWAFAENLDKEKKGSESKVATSATANARAMFQNSTQLGIQIKDNASSGAAQSSADIKTRHKNAISGIWKFGSTSFSTCGQDGRILMWDLTNLGIDLAALKLK